MDSFVLDAQASDIRTELLRERKRRFELEAKLRTLEQRLDHSSSGASLDQLDSKRPLGVVDRVASDAALSPGLTVTAEPTHLISGSRPRSSSEILEKHRNRSASPSPRGKFNLEAERDWFTTLQLPESSNLGSSGYSVDESTGSLEFSRNTSASADGGAADDEERDSGLATPDESDPSFGPSISNSSALRSRFASTGNGLGDSSPTLSGFAEAHSAMHSYSSPWNTNDTTANNTAYNSLTASTANASAAPRRRFDESAVRVSQLKIELAEYKQVLADTGAHMKTLKARCELIEAELADAEACNTMLRAQVREKNSQIISLQSKQGDALSLKQALDAANKEKIALQVELGVSHRAHSATSQSEESLKKQCHTLQTSLSAKDAEMSSKDEMMTKMADKLVQLKLQLQAIVPHLCKFSVSTVGRFTKTVIVSIGVLKPQAGTGAAQLSASSSHHSRELEIVTSGKRVTHPASTVVSIAPSATHPERFAVTYRNGNTDTFDSPKRAEVVASLNLNLFDAAVEADI